MRVLLRSLSQESLHAIAGLLTPLGCEWTMDAELGCDWMMVDAADPAAAERWINDFRIDQPYARPVVAWVESTQPRLARHMLALGADILMCADSSPSLLQIQLLAMDRMSSAMRELYDTGRDLQHFVLLDTESGLLNHHGFKAALYKLHGRSRRECHSLSVILIESNTGRPMPSNDMLSCICRPGDEFGRLAERLYGVLLPGEVDAGAAVVARRLLSLDGWAKRVAVATCHADHPISASELMDIAHEAMAMGRRRNERLIRVDGRSLIA
ncbi:hypothetical protein [Litorivicinus lipolyticus]|uniref:hypothetical protein n=1 Tax=Litorivicinus lipolyticus TaxID=418701 RepID=UPI003B5B2A53